MFPAPSYSRLSSSKSSWVTLKMVIQYSNRQARQAERVTGPFHLSICCHPARVSVKEPFSVQIDILDQKELPVRDALATAPRVILGLEGWDPGEVEEVLQGPLALTLSGGRAVAQGLIFIQPGQRYRLRAVCVSHSNQVDAGTSTEMEVKERPLGLRMAGTRLPHSPREGRLLSPYPGVIITDLVTNETANVEFIQGTTWQAQIRLAYETYPGHLEGTTTVTMAPGSPRALFQDLRLSHWGYHFYLRVDVRPLDSPRRPLELDIGPFDVLRADDGPRVTYRDHHNLTLTYSGAKYDTVLEDLRRFTAYFLNKMGLRFDAVTWTSNISVRQRNGLEVEAQVSGPSQALLDLRTELTESVRLKESLDFVEDQQWQLTSIRMLGKQFQTAGDRSSRQIDSATGISVSWTVAIVLNVLLALILLILVVYCYLRHRRHQKRRHSSESVPHTNGLYSSKAGVGLGAKTALLGTGPPSRVFTVADGLLTPPPSSSPEQTTGWKFYLPQNIGEVEAGNVPPQSLPGLVEEEENDDDDDSFENRASPASPIRPERRYVVYLIAGAARECLGLVPLPGEFPVTLRQLRGFLKDPRAAPPTLVDIAVRCPHFRFLSESAMRPLTPSEDGLLVEQVYPSQGIYISLDDFIPSEVRVTVFPSPPPPFLSPDPLPEEFFPSRLNSNFAEEIRESKPENNITIRRIHAEKTTKKDKNLPYVGPLGMCNAPGCPEPARIKCMSCGTAAYCNTRCLRLDRENHRKSCFRPSWRL